MSNFQVNSKLQTLTIILMGPIHGVPLKGPPSGLGPGKIPPPPTLSGLGDDDKCNNKQIILTTSFLAIFNNCLY